MAFSCIEKYGLKYHGHFAMEAYDLLFYGVIISFLATLNVAMRFKS